MGPLFLFFLLVFSPIVSLFSCFFIFHFFSFVVHFFIFGFFYFFHFLFFIFSEEKVSSFLLCQSLTVSSVVGAPWRCGVLTT